MAIEGGTSKGGTDVRWIPGVLSTARTQENGESTFQPAGLFHPSTIYITEKHWMCKNFQKFFENFDIHGLEGHMLVDFPFSHQYFPLPAGGKAG